MRNRLRWLIIVIIVIGLVPFLDQAFDVDDANFLALAAHAWPHPLRLYDFWMNWTGPLQYAFNTLANPPLVPWYLRLVDTVAHGREWVFHLLFLPLTLLAMAGLYRIGKRFSNEPGWTVVFGITAPVFLIPAHSLMPDVPLLAFFTFGVAIAVEGMDADNTARSFAGGLLAGLSALCRYSGICVIPLLMLYALLNRSSMKSGIAATTAAIVPIAGWSALSWWVYGKVHWLALTGFETDLLTPDSLRLKIIYEIAALGLTVALAAILAFALSRSLTLSDIAAFVAGSALAMDISIWFSMKTVSAVLLVAGFAGASWLVTSALRSFKHLPSWPEKGTRSCDGLFLACWLAGILVFHLSLMFISVRYLITALPPAVLLLQRRVPRMRFSVGVVAACLSLAVSLLVSVADLQLADSYRSYVAHLPPARANRWFTGHWGWQYYLEKSGAHAVANNDVLHFGPDDDVVSPEFAAPDRLRSRSPVPFESVTTQPVYSRFPLRICSPGAEACFYSNWVAPANVPVLLPFGFSQEPLEVFTRIQFRSTKKNTTATTIKSIGTRTPNCGGG